MSSVVVPECEAFPKIFERATKLAGGASQALDGMRRNTGGVNFDVTAYLWRI